MCKRQIESALPMFGFGRRKSMRELEPQQLADMLTAGVALVVDVREPDEFVSGHIAGAINLPLSKFDPAKVPHPGDKTVVLNCLGGKRSGMALDKCRVAQSAIDTHLAGGFTAWTKAGLPVVKGS
jgi:rhodanese-related sulfurtransferase